MRPLPSSNHSTFTPCFSGELSDLVMLERQDRFDLFVGKITRCGYVLDRLPHRLIELASPRPRLAVRPTHRMSGEKCQIVRDGALDPLLFFAGIIIFVPPGQHRLLPGDRRDIPRGSERRSPVRSRNSNQNFSRSARPADGRQTKTSIVWWRSRYCRASCSPSSASLVVNSYLARGVPKASTAKAMNLVLRNRIPYCARPNVGLGWASAIRKLIS